MTINTSEIIFIKSVKDGIPNRDPLNDSDARRLFGEEDGRISLSDVSIKRDVRDYVLARYPDGGEQQRNYIFVRQERTADGKLLGRSSLAEQLKKQATNIKFDNMQEFLSQVAFDVRTFGAVFSVKKENFQFTGPVQFGWAHSLHPVETIYTQGTVVMPSKDIKQSESGAGEEGKTQGTIWTTYMLPFAVFAMPGVINGSIADKTGMDPNDLELLLEALWRGTLYRQARGRGLQQPLLLMHIEYKDKFFRIGYLEEGIKILPGREQWLNGPKPTGLGEIQLDVTDLVSQLNEFKDKIARIRYWVNPSLNVSGTLTGEKQTLW